jgi:hypothetical protein
MTSLIKKFERIIMPILKRMFAIKSEASSAFGSSRRLTILLQELSCLVFKILISLSLSEKKAIRAPETIKDMTRKKSIRITRMVVACTFINKNRPGCPRAVDMLKG